MQISFSSLFSDFLSFIFFFHLLCGVYYFLPDAECSSAVLLIKELSDLNGTNLDKQR